MTSPEATLRPSTQPFAGVRAQDLPVDDVTVMWAVMRQGGRTRDLRPRGACATRSCGCPWLRGRSCPRSASGQPFDSLLVVVPFQTSDFERVRLALTAEAIARHFQSRPSQQSPYPTVICWRPGHRRSRPARRGSHERKRCRSAWQDPLLTSTRLAPSCLNLPGSAPQAGSAG